MLQAIKPKNARSKRALDKKAPQVNENTKKTLFLRYHKCSEITQLVMTDLNSLKRPHTIKFSKKNDTHPFEDASSFEFFADKNDTSMIVYGSHSKKRPHCITVCRTFDYKMLDMIELLIDPTTFRTLQQFKNAKSATGLKPLISFSGTLFESPTPNAYTLARSILLDLLKGEDTDNVDVEGLQYMIHISVGEESPDRPAPKIQFRAFLIRTVKSGTTLPRVEVEEMGPRLDFSVGRTREADPDMFKEALKKPKSLEVRDQLFHDLHMAITNLALPQPKVKNKSITTDMMGDKVGRIHMGKQDLANLQTRKMKALKRDRSGDDVDAAGAGDAGAKRTKV